MVIRTTIKVNDLNQRIQTIMREVEVAREAQEEVVVVVEIKEVVEEEVVVAVVKVQETPTINATPLPKRWPELI